MLPGRKEGKKVRVSGRKKKRKEGDRIGWHFGKRGGNTQEETKVLHMIPGRKGFY